VALDVEAHHLEQAYDQAAALVRRRPDSARAHFALSYVYRYAGLLPEAIRECNAALERDANDRGARSCSIVFLFAGDPQRAQVFADLDKGSGWHSLVLGTIQFYEGQPQEAARMIRRGRDAMGLEAESPFEVCVRGGSEAEVNAAVEVEMARVLGFEDPEPLYPAALGMTFCGLHETALELLSVAVGRRYCIAQALDQDPLLQEVRALPEFRELRERAEACEQKFLAHRDQSRP